MAKINRGISPGVRGEPANSGVSPREFRAQGEALLARIKEFPTLPPAGKIAVRSELESLLLAGTKLLQGGGSAEKALVRDIIGKFDDLVRDAPLEGRISRFKAKISKNIPPANRADSPGMEKDVFGDAALMSPPGAVGGLKDGLMSPTRPGAKQPTATGGAPAINIPELPLVTELHRDADRLHSEFANLKPREQRKLISGIAKTVGMFAQNLSKQAPGEAPVMAAELDNLVYSDVGVLRRMDAPSRKVMLEALGLLSEATSPSLAEAAREALSQMTPEYVVPELSGEQAASRLAGTSLGTCVIGSSSSTSDEFTVYVQTEEGIKEFPLQESEAPNGALLYQFRGGEKYSNLWVLVDCVLKESCGLTVQGETASMLIPASAQRPYGGKTSEARRGGALPEGDKFGKKKVGKVKISHIRSDEGNEYIISNSQAQGGFGKFRYALDENGKRWAVKEFRSEFARHKNSPKTNVTPMTEIINEVEIMGKVGASVQVKDVMNIDGKVYAIMPIMEGEVEDAISQVPKKDRQAVGRSVMRQLAEDLEKCHSRGFIHRDVKPANALFNAEGKIAVSDFGLTIDIPPHHSKLSGVGGTPGYMAPEIVSHAGYDEKIDTWSLAIAVTDVHVSWFRNPFSFSGHPRHDRATCEQFTKWRSGVMTKGKLDPKKFGWGFNKWDSYFKKLHSSDPKLCEFMLNRMLVPDPAERASMEEVRLFMEGLQPPGSPEDKEAQKAFTKIAGHSPKKEAVFQLLESERKA